MNKSCVLLSTALISMLAISGCEQSAEPVQETNEIKSDTRLTCVT
jgi:hypothetical protein